MPRISTAANESGMFCVSVQRCAHGNCKKNGTHHLTISLNSSSESGKEQTAVIDTWYCDKHYNKIIENSK